MKKVLFIVLFLIGIIPSIVSAASIKSVTVNGSNEIIAEDVYSLIVNINFDGINKNDVNSKGIFGVAFDFEYDLNEIGVIGLKTSSPAFTSAYTTQGNQVILASAWNDIDENNVCTDGILYCGNYQMEIKLQSYDAMVGKKVRVKINEVEVILLDQITENTDLNNLDKTATVISYKPNIVKEMIVKKADTTTPKVPITTMPIGQMPNTKKIQIKTSKKALNNDNNLSSLTIDGYNINFKKDVKEYSINIKDNVNSLNINAVPENNKAKVNIIGNNDLKANNDIVTIEVTSESGNKNTYTIKINREGTTTTKNANVDKKKTISKKKLITLAWIIGPIIVVLIIILSVISIVKKVKLSKEIDKYL